MRGHMQPYTLPENTVWTEVAPGNRRAVLSHRPELMLVAFRFEEGAIGALHSHPHTQVSYVAEGELIVHIGDEATQLRRGDIFAVPPNVPHTVQLLSKHVRLVDTFTPLRRDFLK